MGIDVDENKVVTFNPTHERRVVTDVSRPYPIEHLGGLEVRSVFRRRKTAGDARDGNPLVYALKRTQGYTIPRSSVAELARRGLSILGRALADFEADVLAPMPSTSNVVDIVTRRCSRLSPNSEISALFDKATVGQVLRYMPASTEVEHRYRRDYQSYLNKLQRTSPRALIELKAAPMCARAFVRPVVVKREAPYLSGKSILLIDDVLASGTTLTCAAEQLEVWGPSSIKALSLFGKLY